MGWSTKTHISGLILVLLASSLLWAEKFTTFPAAKESMSPDGKFVIRNVDSNAAPGEWTGFFHALVLEEPATGKSRKLCDYFQTAVVAWSGADKILITEYLNAKTSRTLVFSVNPEFVPVRIDKTQLARLLPDSQASILTASDHVYLEAATLVGDTLTLRVWGFGARDSQRFNLVCQYSLAKTTATCRDRATVSSEKP